MRATLPVLLGLLLVGAVLAPGPASASPPRPGGCFSYLLAASLPSIETPDDVAALKLIWTGEFEHAGTLSPPSTAHRCDSTHELNVTSVLRADGVSGIVGVVTRLADESAAAPIAPGPLGSAGVLDADPAPEDDAPPVAPEQVVLSASYAIAWGADCSTPDARYHVTLQDAHASGEPDPDVVSEFCAQVSEALHVDPAALLVAWASHAVDLVLLHTPTPDPALLALRDGLALAAAHVTPAPVSASAPASVHPSDGEGVRSSGEVDARGTTEALVAHATLTADAPHAEVAPEARVDVARVARLQPEAPIIEAPPADRALVALEAALRAREARDASAGAAVDGETPRGADPPDARNPPPEAAGPPPRARIATEVPPAPIDVAPIAAAVVAATVGGVALVAAALVLYQRLARPRALDHPLRAALHAACAASPAPLTAGELARRTGAERKTAEYHLRYLARLGLLREARRADGATLFATPATPDAPAVDPLSEALVGAIRARPGATTQEIAAALGITRTRAERRLRALQTQGRLASSLAEGERRFYA